MTPEPRLPIPQISEHKYHYHPSQISENRKISLDKVISRSVNLHHSFLQELINSDKIIHIHVQFVHFDWNNQYYRLKFSIKKG